MKAALFSMLGLCMAGCGFLYPDIRLTRTVEASEVVGMWTLTEDSLENIRTDGNGRNIIGKATDYFIEINEDGTLRYRSLLQLPTRHIDYAGRWEIKPSSKGKGSVLHLLLDANGGYSLSLDFTEKQGHLFLWTYFGDPDSWRLEMYNKHPNKAMHLTPAR